jgi:hypothetical protein
MYVRAMDSTPPPAPARAWATLSFCGSTGLEWDMAAMRFDGIRCDAMQVAV